MGSAALTYDANGNLKTNGTTAYLYDVENRLIQMTVGGTVKGKLLYDPLGRIFETYAGTPGTARWLYDGDELVAEYSSSGQVVRRYVHGAGVDEPVALYEGAAIGLANRDYLEPDERGSVIGVVNADGTMRQVNSYDEYGIPAAANLGRFQYTGQAWIPELGLYHYKARLYSPTLGRFLQTDPIGYDDQINLYAYVGNDPVSMRDPDGARKCSGVVDCIIAAGETVANSGPAKWTRATFLTMASALGVSVATITNENRRGVKIPVYRVFDGTKALRDGPWWTLEDPRKMKNWRDRLAVYPKWNGGTKVVEGTITMQDMVEGKIQVPPEGPVAKEKEFSAEEGGGPYQGGGNQLIIPDPANTVKDKKEYLMCSRVEGQNKICY